MEGALRNLCRKKFFAACAERFLTSGWMLVRRSGMQADPLQVEWGQNIDPDELKKQLSSGNYDVVTLVHNETSCGMMNPLDEIMQVLREFPDVISIIDTVSSFSVVTIPKDEWGIDVILTGSQKGAGYATRTRLNFCIKACF